MLRRLLLFFLLLASTPALAHATLVLGELRTDPAAPTAGAPFTLSVTLQDPTQVPVEDAVVFAELRPLSAPEAEPLRADLSETQGGTYEARVTLPAGAYRVTLRDQTYRQEEARATVDDPLHVGRANAAQGFVFPPTATGGQSLSTWLLWLLGLPLVAAAVVTVLVLTRGDAPSQPT